MSAPAADFYAESGLENRWTDIFRADTFIHLALLGSITAGTFQGWLKDRIAGPLPYALAPVLLVAAALWWLATVAVRKLKLPDPGGFALRLVALIAVPLLYLLAPGTPLLVEAAGLRAWSLLPLAALIAITIVRSPGQVRAYVWLILALGVVTALYGMWQYREGPAAALGVSGLAEMRHGSSVFYAIPGTGRKVFRAFSTFTFPAPFAGFMLLATLLAIGVVLSPGRRRVVRIVAALAIPLYFIGMTESGTRAAVVTLIVGLLVMAWLGKITWRQGLVGVVLAFGLYLGTLFTSGQISVRYQSINEGALWIYVLAPISIAARAIPAHPFGLGLGRSGVGVPFAITQSLPQGFLVGGDGDIARAAVEMGLIGLLLLGLLLFGVLPFAWRAGKVLAASESDDLGVGLAALLLATGALVLIGSPLSTEPQGTIWWFLLGALVKLALLEKRAAEAPDGSAAGT